MPSPKALPPSVPAKLAVWADQTGTPYLVQQQPDGSTTFTRGLRSNGTESTVKTEMLYWQLFQKALFSLDETYHLNSRLFGAAIRSGIAGV